MSIVIHISGEVMVNMSESLEIIVMEAVVREL